MEAEHGRMSGTVTGLQRLFETARHDLEELGGVLDSRLAMHFQQLGDDEVNPRRTIRRILQLQQRLQKAQERAETMETERKNLAVQALELSTDTASVLKQLQRAANIKPAQHAVIDKDAALQMRECARLHRQSENEQHEDEDVLQSTFDVSSDDNGSQEASNENRAPGPKHGKQGDAVEGKQHRRGAKKSSSKQQQRQQQQQSRVRAFEPVTEQAFMSVSDLVRGRSKLTDVNRVYETLYDHFVKQKKKQSRFHPETEPLTVKEMASMGLKITGKTGEAKLQVLKSLKLISMTNKGVLVNV